MKGGVAAILGAPSGRSRERATLDALDGRARRRARAVRGGRRAGDAGGDPGRGDRRPGDHHRALEPRRRRRPCRRDHVPADRAGPRRPREPQRREGVSALDNLQTLVRALEADEARRNDAETDPLMTASACRTRRSSASSRAASGRRPCWTGSTADGRYGVRLGQTPEAAAERAARVHRGRLRRRPVPARPPGDGRDHRRPVRRPRRVPADHPLPAGLPARGEARDRPHAGAARRALRRGHAAVRQRRRDAVRDLRPGRRPGRAQRRRVTCPLDEVEACARVLAAWVSRGARPRLTGRYEATMSIPPATSAARTAARRWARRASDRDHDHAGARGARGPCSRPPP